MIRDEDIITSSEENEDIRNDRLFLDMLFQGALREIEYFIKDALVNSPVKVFVLHVPNSDSEKKSSDDMLVEWFIDSLNSIGIKTNKSYKKDIGEDLISSILEIERSKHNYVVVFATESLLKTLKSNDKGAKPILFDEMHYRILNSMPGHILPIAFASDTKEVLAKLCISHISSASVVAPGDKYQAFFKLIEKVFLNKCEEKGLGSENDIFIYKAICHTKETFETAVNEGIYQKVGHKYLKQINEIENKKQKYLTNFFHNAANAFFEKERLSSDEVAYLDRPVPFSERQYPLLTGNVPPYCENQFVERYENNNGRSKELSYVTNIDKIFVQQLAKKPQISRRPYVIALLGPPGYGKTTIAKALATSFSRETFWVEVSNKTQLVDLFSYFEKKNFNTDQPPRLIILDGADKDIETLIKEIPRAVNCGILLTSTNRRWYNCSIIQEVKELFCFTEAESLIYLRNRNVEGGDTILAEISKELGYLPATLDEFCGYYNSSTCSTKNYLQMFRNLSSLDEGWHEHMCKLRDACLGKINIREEGLQFLDLVAYFASDNIPTAIVASYKLEQLLNDSVISFEKGSDKEKICVNPLIKTLFRYTHFTEKRIFDCTYKAVQVFEKLDINQAENPVLYFSHMSCVGEHHEKAGGKLSDDFLRKKGQLKILADQHSEKQLEVLNSSEQERIKKIKPNLPEGSSIVPESVEPLYSFPQSYQTTEEKTLN